MRRLQSLLHMLCRWVWISCSFLGNCWHISSSQSRWEDGIFPKALVHGPSGGCCEMCWGSGTCAFSLPKLGTSISNMLTMLSRYSSEIGGYQWVTVLPWHPLHNQEKAKDCIPCFENSVMMMNQPEIQGLMYQRTLKGCGSVITMLIWMSLRKCQMAGQAIQWWGVRVHIFTS